MEEYRIAQYAENVFCIEFQTTVYKKGALGRATTGMPITKWYKLDFSGKTCFDNRKTEFNSFPTLEDARANFHKIIERRNAQQPYPIIHPIA